LKAFHSRSKLRIDCGIVWHTMCSSLHCHECKEKQKKYYLKRGLIDSRNS